MRRVATWGSGITSDYRSTESTANVTPSAADVLIEFVLAYGMESRLGIVCAAPVLLPGTGQHVVIVSMKLVVAAARIFSQTSMGRGFDPYMGGGT